MFGILTILLLLSVIVTPYIDSKSSVTAIQSSSSKTAGATSTTFADTLPDKETQDVQEASPPRLASFTWELSRPITVESVMDNRWTKGVAYGVNQWHQAFPRLQLNFVANPGGECKSKTHTIIICGKANFGYSGITIVKHPGGKAISAKIIIDSNDNYASSPWDPSDPDSITEYYVSTIMHELGHAWGLNHDPYFETSIMYRDSSLLAPGPYDIESMHLLYDGKKPSNNHNKKNTNKKGNNKNNRHH